MYKIFTRLTLIAFVSCYYCQAINLEIKDNFYTEIDFIESESYQLLLQNLSKELDVTKKVSKPISSSENTLSIESKTLSQVSLIRKALNLDKLISHFKLLPPKIEIIEEEEDHGAMTQRLKITDRLVGVFEARIVFPTSSTQKHPMILGLHGHGDSSYDFINQPVSLDLLKKGFGIFSVSFRAMRRIYEAPISRQLVERGYHLMGIRLYETYIAWQILKSHPLVNSQKIAVLAHSGGSLVANLFVRVFPQFKALIYDYTSSFHRDWDKLCCEALPKLKPYRENLQLADKSPIPALKVSYGFTKDSNTILEFFSKNVLNSIEEKSVGSMGGTTKTTSSRDSHCANYYATLQDKCLLRAQIDDYFMDKSEINSLRFSQLRMPRFKIQYILEKLIFEKNSVDFELKSNLMEILKIISKVNKSELRTYLISLVNKSVCKLGVEYCDLWLGLLKAESTTSLLVSNLDDEMVLSTISSDSVSASTLIKYLPTRNSKIHALLNLAHGTANSKLSQSLKVKLSSLLKNDSKRKLSKCVKQLLDRDKFEPTCWENNLVSDYVSKTNSIPQYLKNSLNIDNQKLVNVVKNLYEEPNAFIYGLLGNVNTEKISASQQTELNLQLEEIYSNSLKRGDYEEFMRELLPYLRLFNLKLRYSWISKALLSTKIDSSPHESKVSRLEIMQEALEIMSHYDLAKIISMHNDLFDVSMFSKMIVQAAEIDRLDHVATLFKELDRLSSNQELGSFEELRKELNSIELQLRSNFQILIKKIKIGEDFEDLADWYVELSDKHQSVLNLIKSELFEDLMKKFPNFDLNEPSLQAWFCFYEIFKELNHKWVDGWLKTSFKHSLNLADVENSQKIQLAVYLLEYGDLEYAETILSQLEDKDSKYENEASLYRKLFVVNSNKRDLGKYIRSIKILDSFSRLRLIRLLFESISRDEFIQNYETLIELSRDEENSESSRLNFEWVRCAIRLNFFTDAALELERLHSNQQKNGFKQRSHLGELIELWVELGYTHKAREILLKNLRNACSSLSCFSEITPLALTTIDNDRDSSKLFVVKEYFEQLNHWLSKNDFVRGNFCSEIGFEEYCDGDGYFSNL